MGEMTAILLVKTVRLSLSLFDILGLVSVDPFDHQHRKKCVNCLLKINLFHFTHRYTRG